MTKEIRFMEVGCANNAADLIQPCIDKGWRGVFVDANQDILVKRRQSLLLNTNSHVEHLFLCTLIGVQHALSEFYRTDFGFSSCEWSHVDGHIVANHLNKNLGSKERDYELQEVSPIWMVTITLADLFGFADVKDLEVLNIDLEGFDCHIIAATDFSVFRPKIICFEHSHSERVFIGGGKNYEKAVTHLQSFGYESIEKNVNDTVMRLKI